MITSRRILIGTIVAFVVVAAGFGLGLRMQKSDENPSSEESASAAAPINNNTYEISPPSNGVLLETYPININPEGFAAYVKIPEQESTHIKTGQKIFLYDQNGELKDSLGEVVAVSRPDGDKLVLVEISLNGNPDISPSIIARGKIIIDRKKNVDRLPYSALVRSENGKTYLWEVTKGMDGVHTANRVDVEVLGGNDLMFSMETKPGHSNTFILNPDANLRDTQKVNVREFFYRPPSQYEDQRIEAIVNQRLNNLAAATATPPPSASNCAQAPSVTQDFINKVKSLSAQPVTP